MMRPTERVGFATFLSLFFFFFVASLLGLVSGASISASNGPVVQTKQGRLVGNRDFPGQHTFLGVPYAKKPRRFARPQPLELTAASRKRVVDATAFGPSCSQPDNPASSNKTSEDCLTLDVYVPAVEHEKPLPVLVWIYGGSFLVGSTSHYNASKFVEESVKAGEPVIVVGANYRLGAFGWLASKDVEDDADGAVLNAALHDQRLALHWVHDNIHQFGGDCSKVTLWGQSAGAVSVALQLLYRGGDNRVSDNENAPKLFRAAILHSGAQAVQPTFPASSPQIELRYQALLKAANCTTGEDDKSNGSALDCLRNLDADALTTASLPVIAMLQASVQGGGLAFPPVQDDVFVPGSPKALIDAGKSADVPLLTGNVLDEGTIFALQNLVNETLFSDSLAAEASLDPAQLSQEGSTASRFINRLTSHYPDVPQLGSPYLNEPTRESVGLTGVRLANRTFAPLATNQFKRSAAVSGDLFFQAQRRSLLASYLANHPKQPLWAYLFAQNDKDSSNEGGSNIADPNGVEHGSDLYYFFGPTVQLSSPGYDERLGRRMKRAWISFAAHLNPNKLAQEEGSDDHWPRFDKAGGDLMQFKGGNITVIPDTYREAAMDFIRSPEATKQFRL